MCDYGADLFPTMFHPLHGFLTDRLLKWKFNSPPGICTRKCKRGERLGKALPTIVGDKRRIVPALLRAMKQCTKLEPVCRSKLARTAKDL